MRNKRKLLKRIILWLLLTPVILVVVTTAVFYIPSVQQWAANVAVKKMEELTGMKATVGKFRMGFPLKPHIEDVLLLSPAGDTLASLGLLRTDLPFRPLLKGQIEPQELKIRKVYFNSYLDSLKESKLILRASELDVAGVDVNTKRQRAAVSALRLRGGFVTYWSIDTIPDPNAKPVDWTIEIGKSNLQDFASHIELPYDHVWVHAQISKGKTDKIKMALAQFTMGIDWAHLNLDSVSVASKEIESTAPFVDYEYMSFFDVDAEVREFLLGDQLLAFHSLGVKATERSGAVVDDFTGDFSLDHGVVSVEDFDVTTPYSRVEGDVRLPLQIFGDTPDMQAAIKAVVAGELDARDLLFFTGIDLYHLVATKKNKVLPPLAGPAQLDINVEGNLTKLSVERIDMYQPYVGKINLKGLLHNPLQEKRRSGEFLLSVGLERDAQRWLHYYAPDLSRRVILPGGTRIDGKVAMQNGKTGGNIILKSAGGTVEAQGFYHSGSKQYAADVQIDYPHLMALLPQDSVGAAYASVQLSGTGLDPLGEKAKMQLHVDVNRIQYKHFDLRDVNVDGRLANQQATINIESATPGAQLSCVAEAVIANRTIDGQLNLTIDTLSTTQLGMTGTPLAGKIALAGKFFTDLKEEHRIHTEVKDGWVAVEQDLVEIPYFLLDVATSSDLVLGKINSGDLRINLEAKSGLNGLTRRIGQLVQGGRDYIRDSVGQISLEVPMRLLPELSLEAAMGTNNPLRPILRRNKIDFTNVDIALRTDSLDGITGDFLLNGFRKDTLRIDRAYMSVSTNFMSPADAQLSVRNLVQRLSETSMQPVLAHSVLEDVTDSKARQDKRVALLNIDLSVSKERYKNQEPFELTLTAETDLKSVDLYASYADALGIQYAVGLVGYYNKQGFGLAFREDKPIYLAREPLKVNPENSLFYFREGKRIYANLQLTGYEGAELSLMSNNQDPTVEQFNLTVKQLRLEEIASLTKVEDLGGLTFADVLIEREGNKIRATGDLSVNEFLFDGNAIGNVGVAFFYEPRDDHSHYVTAQVNHNGSLVLSADGRYNATQKESPIDMLASFEQFPLELLNPLVGVNVASLSGWLEGGLKISGTPQNIRVTGQPFLKDAKVFLPQLGNTFEMDNKPLKLEHSKLSLDRFALRVEGKKEAMYLTGYLYVLGKQAMQGDLKLEANEVQLLDSKYRPGQIVYGTLYSSADLSLRGHLASPIIRGDIGILGGTNLMYVNTKAEVKAGDNMAGVVEFVDFADTLFVAQPIKENVALKGMDIAVNLQIDPAVMIGVDLSPGHQDYVQIVGGGELRFTMSRLGQMSLLGTYEASGGEVKYYFPVVGRKTFDIEPSSTISWSGNPSNPYLSFKASHKERATVVEEGGVNRKVDFEVSIAAKEALENLNLQFDLAAPQDFNVQNQLSGMSPEERGKQAVALMVTGTFLPTATQGMKMEQILSGLVMNELNNLTDKILDGTDLNVGMELNDPYGTGQVYTDYTYSFSRRFFNNRIRFVIGGKVAAGNLPTGYEQTFIDNVALEYRLDKAGKQYLSLFHKRNNDNLLEGPVTETGVGYIIKLKLRRLQDLFLRYQAANSQPQKSSPELQTSREAQKAEETVVPNPNSTTSSSN